MEQHLRARLGASRILLQQHAGKPSFSNISRLQSDAVIQLAKTAVTELSAATRADLVSVVMSVPWSTGHGEAILAVFTPTSPQEVVIRRRRQQCYTPALMSYLTQAEWDILMQLGDHQCKLECILQALLQLGLRCPSEPTLKMATSLWILCTHDDGQQLALLPAQKTGLHTCVKGRFDAMRRRALDPSDWILVLPQSPQEFERCHSDMWTTRYGLAVPVPPPICIRTLLHLDASYGCRGGRQVAGQLASVGGGSSSNVEALLVQLLSRQLGTIAHPTEPTIQFLPTCHRTPPVPMRRLPTATFSDSPSP